MAFIGQELVPVDYPGATRKQRVTTPNAIIAKTPIKIRRAEGFFTPETLKSQSNEVLFST
jgi:hypothetical protein